MAEFPDLEGSVQGLIEELDTIDSRDRPYYFISLMLRDGFEAIAPWVPPLFRSLVETTLCELSTRDEIVVWGEPQPNKYRETFLAWSKRLAKEGWPAFIGSKLGQTGGPAS